MQQDKNRKKEYTRGKNYQEGLWQENYLDGQIRGMTKNIGEYQKEIRDNGREDNLREEECWG